jgi:hypothetical protein
VTLDQVRDDFGIGLGVELVSVRNERFLELAVVLHDAVQHERQLPVVAASEGMCVLLRHAAVGRPAGMAEPGGRLGAVQQCRCFQMREVADGADVVQLVVFAEHDPG